MSETEMTRKINMKQHQVNSTHNPSKKSHSFLSSVFSSRNLFNSDDKNEKTSHAADEKSPSFLSSMIGSNHGLLSDLSLKLEAAFNLSLDDSDSSSRSDGTSRKNSATDKQSDSSSLVDLHSRPQMKGETVSRHHHYTKRKGRKPKDRSVYGQPEIKMDASELKLKTWKDLSQESLDTVDSGHSMDNSLASLPPESKLNMVDPFYIYRTESLGIGSESDPCGQSTSLESSDAESIPDSHAHAFTRCGSSSSLQSWASSPSCESQPDDITLECMEFMKTFVASIFSESSKISFDDKAKFGELCQHELGRLWFARYVNSQRVQCKQVSESTFFSLIQHFAIVLFECFEADDFAPAKSIMNMCFTFYHETSREGRCRSREYLFNYLMDQPIWRSIRFWNAAFFDAVQCERANRHIPTRTDMGTFSPEDYRDEKCYQENIVFGQLGTFTYNMFAFGLTKEFCMGFLKKQCTIASLSNEHVSLLMENIDRMFRGDIGKEV